MKILILPAIVLSTVILTACQSTPVAAVIQRENHTYETTGIGKTKLIAQQNALTSANAQCGKHGSPVVLSDSVTYNGVLDEGLGRAADKATKVVTGIFGRSTSLASDDDYEYKISFRCQ